MTVRTRLDLRPSVDTYAGTSRVANVFTTKFHSGDYRRSRCVDELHSGPPFRDGGPLSISRETITYRHSAPYYGWSKGTVHQSYRGDFTVGSYTPGVLPSEQDLTALGAIGWNRSAPTRPIMNVPNFAYEMREIPGMVAKTAAGLKSMGKDFVRDPGGHYLNHQFGWAPYFRDLMQILDLQETLEKRLRQLRRDNGRPIRRGMTLRKNQRSENVQTLTNSVPMLNPVLSSNLVYNQPGYQKITKLIFREDVWFEAVFRYWVPELADPRKSDLRLRALLLGLTPTADVIYKSTPWSWLVDWFSSTGSILQNMTLNSAYHLTAKYAYVMGHTSYDYQTTGNGRYRAGEFLGTNNTEEFNCWCTTHHKYEFKKRTEANPYGFGITDGDLNAYQWSILAALGLAKLR